MTAGPAKPARSSLGVFVATGLALLLAVAVGAWWLWPLEWGMGGGNTIERVVAQIRSWGRWAALGSIALMVAHSFLPFPAEIITMANGMVFGPLWGSVITWIGAMLGALATFGLVRLLGRPFVHRMLSDGQLQRLSRWSSTQGGWLIMMIMLMPMAGAGFFGMAMGIMAPVMTLVLHIIFGAVLGWTYGKLHTASWQVDAGAMRR